MMVTGLGKTRKEENNKNSKVQKARKHPADRAACYDDLSEYGKMKRKKTCRKNANQPDLPWVYHAIFSFLFCGGSISNLNLKLRSLLFL